MSQLSIFPTSFYPIDDNIYQTLKQLSEIIEKYRGSNSRNFVYNDSIANPSVALM
jgi:hypothetical protein